MRCRKQILKAGILIAGIILAADASAATLIQRIDFIGTSQPNQIVIQGNGPLDFTTQDNAQDKQVIVEIKNAKLANSNAGRKLDTSSFNSKVALISPYQVEGSDTVRVVIQMREPGKIDVAAKGNALQATVDGASTGGSDQASAPAAAPADAQAPSGAPDARPATAASQNSSAEPTSADSSALPTFNGKHITLQVRNADISDVFRLIGEASGFNIVLGSEVKGQITLSLVDVPWDLALDTVLKTMKLGAQRNQNILRIVSLKELANEQREELIAKQVSQANAVRITRVFPINYAKLEDIQKALEKFATASTQASAGIPNTDPSTVQIDKRTNSLIVRDIAENIEKMKKLIEILDTQTPQVLIEAKVVEANEKFSKSLGGNIGLQAGDTAATNNTRFAAAFAGSNPIDPLLSSSGTTGVLTGSSMASSSGTGGQFGFSPVLSFLPGLRRLNAILSVGETESQARIVASPRTVVLNQETASIVQGTPVLVPGTTTSNGVILPVTTVQSANLSLNVTPTVTNDGNVLLKLTISRDTPESLGSSSGTSQSGVASRNLTTNVVVESGTTLVIGGIYSNSTTHSEQGFPFLRKIPILGALFGSESSGTERSELFIFVTPRILNEKEAGIGA